MKKYLSILIILAVSFTSNSQETEDRYIIKNLSINNAYSNFGTSFYGNKLVYASPAKRNYIINNVWKPNNQPFLDLYVGDINSNGDLSNTKKFSDVVNTKYHEADVTFTKDLKTVYFTRSNYFEGKYGKDSLGINRLKLFKAKVDASGNWFNVEPLPFNDDNYSVGHPSLSEDEQTLYFVSDMPGTMGETDIFKVAVYTDGTYGNPENLGPEVNTVNKEMFPYIDGNDELYYSSNGKDGEGMLDIYVNKILPDGILPAINLGKSINSDKDDFAFIINKEKREGYFSSNRSGGKGDDDIYYFKEEKPADFKCTETLQFVVKNKKTGEIVPNALINIFENEAIVSELVTNNKGICNFEANCLTNYNVEASGNFFITKQLSVKTSNKNQQTNVITIELMPDEFIVIRDKVMIDINTIYFDYDKFNIRPDAALELNKVVEVMKKYPELKVEAGSHTDSRGPDAYNDVLSEKRASSTVEYIVSKGISADRISGKGYGEKQLTNKCSNGVKCTSEEHQLNRRTEFVIVNPEVIN